MPHFKILLTQLLERLGDFHNFNTVDITEPYMRLCQYLHLILCMLLELLSLNKQRKFYTFMATWRNLQFGIGIFLGKSKWKWKARQFGLHRVVLKLRSFRSESNRRLRATVGQKSSRVQMASEYHVGAAVLVHVARRRRLDSDLDERSLKQLKNDFSR